MKQLASLNAPILHKAQIADLPSWQVPCWNNPFGFDPTILSAPWQFPNGDSTQNHWLFQSIFPELEPAALHRGIRPESDQILFRCMVHMHPAPIPVAAIL